MLISVQMPAYNAEKYVRQAVRSVLAQTHRDLELIVVDDASTDGTARILAEEASTDDRIRVFRHSRRLGEAEARNQAFAHSRGVYIARLDADDWDEPTRLEESVARLEASPHCDIVGCDMWMHWPDRDWPADDSPSGMIPNLWMAGTNGGAPCNGSLVAKQWVYEAAHPFDPQLKVGTDSDWDARALLAGARFAHIRRRLYHYRKYEGQMVSTIPTSAHLSLQQQRVNRYWPLWQADYNPQRTLALLVTGECNLDCSHCSQGAFRRDKLDAMTIPQFKRVVDRCAEIGAQYRWFEFSGGEPTLWPGLLEAVRIIRSTKVAEKIRLFSNAHCYMELTSFAALVDQVYTTEANSGPTRCAEMKAQLGKKAVIDGLSKFKPLPTSPVEGTLPAQCNCDRLCVIGDKVWSCSNAYTHLRRMGENPLAHADLWCSVEDDWIEHFRFVKRFDQPMCSICLANKLVWPRAPYEDGTF